MRLAIMTLAVGAAFSMSAHAQSNVQIYGIADAGVEYVNKVRTGGPGSDTDSVLRLQSGNASASRIGFRGVEDLGGGLKAVFNLENGFAIDAGTATQGGRLFGRTAYVGLGGAFGEIQLGRQSNAIFEFGLKFDPLSGMRYSTTVFDASYAGRADNAVKYAGKFGGANVKAQYSFGADGSIAGGGEVAGAYKVGKEMGVQGDYQIGAVTVGAAYDRQNGTSVATASNTNERTVVGATWNLKPVKLFAAYQRQKLETASTDTVNKLYWVGASYAVSQALTLSPTLYVYDPEGAENRSTMLAVFGSYKLSKRTDLYSLVGYMKNQDRATAGMGGAVNAGDNQSSLIVGVRHRF